MNYKLNIIGTHSANSAFESIYVPFVSFANEEQKKLIENYIFLQIDKFFEKLYPTGVIRSQLSYSKLITEEDFKKVKIAYFYDNLFHDLERGSDGKLKLKIKWSITFDDKCTPIQLVNISPSHRGYKHKLNDFSDKDTQGRPHRKYGTIEINGKPVFYYIYFTLQEILDVAKQKSI
jgi:hypothetical protein